MASNRELDAMRRALILAASDGVPLGPNPRVGAVVLNQGGQVVGEGFHRGAGNAHAEIEALKNAGDRARGGVAVVTLEPCNHRGRTGPCSQALVAAGIERVVFAQADTSPTAQGGADFLTSRGVDVEGHVLTEEAEQLNPRWTFAHEHARPWVTYKFAATLDGRVAAPDGTSQWVTGEAARRDVHVLRSQVDAVMVGTGTVLQDNPRLTARGVDVHRPQPKRVVVGERAIPPDFHLLDSSADTIAVQTHDLTVVLESLYQRDIHWVLLEGGPTLAGAFVSADLIDEVIAYIAPALLGAGQHVLATPEVQTIREIRRLKQTSVEPIGADVKFVGLVDRQVHSAEPLRSSQEAARS